MLESITYHTFLEAIGINVIVALFLYPVMATVWDVSKARYIKDRLRHQAASLLLA